MKFVQKSKLYPGLLYRVGDLWCSEPDCEDTTLMFEVESSEGFHKFLPVQYPGTLFREVQGCTNPILFTADHIQMVRNLKWLHNAARWLCWFSLVKWSSCLVHTVQFQHFQHTMCSESRIMNIKTCQHHCINRTEISINKCVTFLLQSNAQPITLPWRESPWMSWKGRFNGITDECWE